MGEKKIFGELEGSSTFLVFDMNGSISNNYVYMKISTKHFLENCVRLYDGVLFIVKDDQEIMEVLL